LIPTDLISTPHRRLDKLPQASSCYLCFDAGYGTAAIEILNKNVEVSVVERDATEIFRRAVRDHFAEQ
jgi:hypothetical protein